MSLVSFGKRGLRRIGSRGRPAGHSGVEGTEDFRLERTSNAPKRTPRTTGS